MTSRARRLLLVLLWFGAVSALAGGVLGVAANGAGVPLGLLAGTSFTSYRIPGAILGVVIGGTQGWVAIATQQRHASHLLAASVAGFGMVIWVFVELAVLGEHSWLQAVYVGLGVLELVLVLVLLGVLGPAPRTTTGSVHPP